MDVPGGQSQNHDGGSRVGAKVGPLPDRFVSTEDVVAKEFADLAFPWDLANIEERIGEYTTFSEKIDTQLSFRVMQNYNEFVQGMQQVQAVETELTLIGVLVKNGRRKLHERDLGLVKGSMQVAKQHKKSQRLASVLTTLSDFQEVVQLQKRLDDSLNAENYCEAIAQHKALVESLADERFCQFPGIVGLREGLSLSLSAVQQRLSDGLRVAAVSAEFDHQRYENILKAYSMMSPDQALSVGKELLRHITECIVAVSRQCMLMFSDSRDDAPPDWHRKAQLRDLCRSMEPTQFVDCTAKLYEHLCDFLYKHEFLCRWHEHRAQNAEPDAGSADDHRFREVLRDVQSELAASKRNVWHHVSQQVSLVLMTLEFQYPALNEENFLQIVNLTRTLMEEGDSFMADYQPATARAAGSNTNWRQWSAPIKNTLKSKAHDYFQSLHYNVWSGLKVAYVDQDSWQRLPVAKNYKLFNSGRLRPPRKECRENARENADGSPLSEPKCRNIDSNPFRNYKAISQQFLAEEQDGGDADDIDDHALLQHWIDDSESLPADQIGSALLSNSNLSPVVSTSSVELARLLEKYFRMMGALPELAADVFQSATQLIEFYVYCVLSLFVQDRHLRAFFEDLSAGMAHPDPNLASRHESLLLQRLCPDLRRTAMRVREHASNLQLPDSCSVALNVHPPVSGQVLLHITPFSKLLSPASLCGLPERCVGAESARALLDDLTQIQGLLCELLPKSEREAVDPFLTRHALVTRQLYTLVLRCGASDILEIPPVGKVSLDIFSNTMMDLKWDARDFSQGSPGAPYVDQLRNQIAELARRIPSAGGGSIRQITQEAIWGWVEVRLMQECIEVVAKCGRKKSQEALQCLAEDFESIRKTGQQSFQSHCGQPGGPDVANETSQLLPVEHPLLETTQWSFLHQYLDAHSCLPADIGKWCKSHPEYPFRLHKAVVEYMHGSNQKVQRQVMTEFEVYLSDHIAEMVRDMGDAGRGL